jgi:hypothetical protein
MVNNELRMNIYCPAIDVRLFLSLLMLIDGLFSFRLTCRNGGALHSILQRVGHVVESVHIHHRSQVQNQITQEVNSGCCTPISTACVKIKPTI